MTRIVRSDEMQDFVRQMRERVFGLGDCAIHALQHALREQRDGRLAFQLLLSIGVIPSQREREVFATRQAAQGTNEADGVKTRASRS